MELEEELRVVGNNLKSLELSEEKALEKEDIFAEQIRQLDFRLKEVRGVRTSVGNPYRCFTSTDYACWPEDFF